MSEQRQPEERSPLVSDRGVTTISDSVVSQVAGIALREVPGLHLGGGASRSAGGLLDNITGSSGNTRGISVEVGKVETALDITLSIDYGTDILPALDDARRRISERLGEMTGLQVTECNVTISDVVFPDSDGDSGAGKQRGELESGSGAVDRSNARTVELESEVGDREVGEVEPSSRTHTDSAGRPAAEEVRVEDEPLDKDETVRMDARDLQGDESTRESRRERARRERSNREDG